jgi:hypothetical protein
MGSIELFPRTQLRRAAPAAAFRSLPAAVASTVRVREARPGDFSAVRALQMRNGHAALSLRQFESRLHGFAEGQLVAICDAEVVGYAATLVLDWDAQPMQPTWAAATGDGYFTPHSPGGSSLFCAETFLEATPRRFDASRAFVQARRKLCRRLNLRRTLATPSLQGYSCVADRLSPEQYATRILWGDAVEPTWRFLIAQGFQFCGLLRGFTPPGDSSCGNAGLFAWLNPLYGPPGPPASERRCA